MNQDFESIWYVEIEGQRQGPFPLDRIQELFQMAKLRPNDRVTAHHLGNRWITVREASEAYLRRTATGTIQLPPRPQEAPSSVPPKSSETDPVLGLFDVIQHAKSRQAASRSPLASVKGSSEAGWKIPGQVWLILSITAVLAISIGVIFRLVQKSSSLVNVPTLEKMEKAAVTPPLPPSPLPTQLARPAPPPAPSQFQARPQPAAVPPPVSREADRREAERREQERLEQERRETERREHDRRDTDRAQERTQDQADRLNEGEDWRARDERGEVIPPIEGNSRHEQGTPSGESRLQPGNKDHRENRDSRTDLPDPLHNPTGQ